MIKLLCKESNYVGMKGCFLLIFFKTVQKLNPTQRYVTANRQILLGLYMSVPTERHISNTNLGVGFCNLLSNPPATPCNDIIYYDDSNKLK